MAATEENYYGGEEKVERKRTKKNKYLMISRDGHSTGLAFHGVGINQAALQAASRGHEDIILYNTNTHKVHRYCGCNEPIEEHNQTHHTRKYGIVVKPKVKSVPLDYAGRASDMFPKKTVS